MQPIGSNVPSQYQRKKISHSQQTAHSSSQARGTHPVNLSLAKLSTNTLFAFDQIANRTNNATNKFLPFFVQCCIKEGSLKLQSTQGAEANYT